MAQHTTTVDVPVTPDVAFAYLADLTNSAGWDPSIAAATRVDDGPIGVGATFLVVIAAFGKRIELATTIERHEAPTSLAFVGTHKNAVRRDTITFEPGAGGARVTTATELRLKGALRLLDKGLQMQLVTMADRAAAGLAAALTAPVRG
jgi:hypothetical protein